jgi:2',3'-cyclic-nucleotide 2'-phosphodiesterase (5'-nucleotidase family)
MSQFDQIIFKNKSFGNVLEEIYENQKKKDKQVSALINELKPMIEEIGDATLIVPLIKEYMEIGVKNDEMLVNMAALAQRAMNSASGENALGISDEEKEQLLSEISKLKSE